MLLDFFCTSLGSQWSSFSITTVAVNELFSFIRDILFEYQRCMCLRVRMLCYRMQCANNRLHFFRSEFSDTKYPLYCLAVCLKFVIRLVCVFNFTGFQLFKIWYAQAYHVLHISNCWMHCPVLCNVHTSFDPFWFVHAPNSFVINTCSQRMWLCF